MASLSSTVLNRNSESGCSCLVPRAKLSRFSALVTVIAVDSVYRTCALVRGVSPIITFVWRSFILNDVAFCHVASAPTEMSIHCAKVSGLWICKC